MHIYRLQRSVILKKKSLYSGMLLASIQNTQK